ncbi:streptococcal hemagglutinin-like protein [Leishmania tarentolae]|uniref:Streptococcal hemagglutinin-like protein n=1 Tax=Leishmania tarentolae TaxID=5689 RepID=A0A640KU41_LEITA|nr:streptococcal hemagglutinin-like protein [Leishmania tarentolae]
MGGGLGVYHPSPALHLRGVGGVHARRSSWLLGFWAALLSLLSLLPRHVFFRLEVSVLPLLCLPWDAHIIAPTNGAHISTRKRRVLSRKMRITAATGTPPVHAQGGKIRKGNPQTIRTVAAAGSGWRPQSHLVFTSSATSATTTANGKLGMPTAEGVTSTNGNIVTSSPLEIKAVGNGGRNSFGVSSVHPIPTAPSSGSAQVPPLSLSRSAALENHTVAGGTLEAARRSGTEGFPCLGEKGVFGCTMLATENGRRAAEVDTTDDLGINNPTTSTTADAPLWAAGGSPSDAFRDSDTGGDVSAVAVEGAMSNSPFVSSSSSASSDRGCVQRARASPISQRSSVMHKCDSGTLAKQPQLLLPLEQDNRGFLNPGYSCDSPGWSSEDSGDSSKRVCSESSASETGRQSTPLMTPLRRAVPLDESGDDCSDAPPSVSTTHLCGDTHQNTLTLFPLTAAEEQSARQAYDAYRAHQRKTDYHRSRTSAINHRSKRSAFVSPPTLSPSTSVGKRELLRLLRGLHHRAQATMACTTNAIAPTSTLPQRKVVSPTMMASTANVLHRFPTTKYLINAAEACFGTRRVQTLMAAAVSESDALAPMVVQHDGGAPAVYTASQSRLPSSSPELAMEEALSFFRYLKSELSSGMSKQQERRQAELPAQPEAAAVDKGRSRPAKAASSQSLHDLHRSQKAHSISFLNSQAASPVPRLPSAQAGRRSGRPPPTPIARMEEKRTRPASCPPSSPSPSRPGIPGVQPLVGHRKPTGRHKGPRRKTALPPPSPCPFRNNSCTPEVAYKDDFIHTYVQRKAFAEIAECQGCQDSTTVSLEKLMKVLARFELALNTSVIERLCSVQGHCTRESQDISIDFGTFAKIIDSGLRCQRGSGGSGASSAPASASPDNDDPQFESVLLLRPGASARASPVVPPIPGLAAADDASLSTGNDSLPYAKVNSSAISVHDSEGSNPSLLVSAQVSATANRRLSSLSSRSTSTTSSLLSGSSMHRPFVDTVDAYPLVAHDSAIAALCRSIRHRLRGELRRTASRGPNALLRLRNDHGIVNEDDDGADQKEKNDPQHSPPRQTAPAYSRSWKSLPLASSAPSPTPRENVGVAGLSSERGSPPARRDSEEFLVSPHLSKWLRDTKRSTRFSRQRLREQVSPSRLVAHALPSYSHSYTLTQTPRDPPAQPNGSDEDAITSQCPPTPQGRRGRKHRPTAPPSSRPATARRPFLFTGAARRCRQRKGPIQLFMSLSPYSNSGYVNPRHTINCWSRSATLSRLNRPRRSPSLYSCDSQSQLNSLRFSESDMPASFLSQSLPVRPTSMRPKRNRPASAYTQYTTAPTHDAYAARASHTPFSPAITSPSLPYPRRHFQAR